MRTYECPSCNFRFNETDKSWDFAYANGTCPHCFKSLDNFNIPTININQYDSSVYKTGTEMSANPLEMWILNLDKYIDVQYRSQIRKLGFKVGIFCSLIIFFILEAIHFLSRDIFIEMMIPFVLSMAILIIQSELWYAPRRIEQEYGRKQPYDCGCNRSGIPKFNERGWISRRFFSQYSCNLHQMWFTFSWGWLLMALPLTLINWVASKSVYFSH